MFPHYTPPPSIALGFSSVSQATGSATRPASQPFESSHVSAGRRSLERIGLTQEGDLRSTAFLSCLLDLSHHNGCFNEGPMFFHHSIRTLNHVSWDATSQEGAFKSRRIRQPKQHVTVHELAGKGSLVQSRFGNLQAPSEILIQQIWSCYSECRMLPVHNCKNMHERVGFAAYKCSK